MEGSKECVGDGMGIFGKMRDDVCEGFVCCGIYGSTKTRK